MVDARPIARRLLALVLDELAWLEEHGYARIGIKDLETRFTVNYGGPKGRVAVAVDAARNTVEIWLSPPDPDDPAAIVNFGRGRGGRIMLQALMAMRELPVPSDRWPRPSDAEHAVRASLEALRRVRDHELGGDWSRLDEARAAGRAERRRAAEDVRDPQMRAIMRAVPRQRGRGALGDC